METRLTLDILPQPDDTTCGPTCLHSVYRYYGDVVDLDDVLMETAKLDEGGTLAVLLGCHALMRGYRAKIYTYNLHVFDPTWFGPEAGPLSERLEAQMRLKHDAKLTVASLAYIEFLKFGGQIVMEDLTSTLIRKYLSRGTPILAGLSATYLYSEAREFGPEGTPDDLRGQPTGHFVVLCGYDARTRRVLVADPLMANPFNQGHFYEVDLARAVSSILLGILTYDANLLILQPPQQAERSPGAGAHRRES